MRYAGMIFLLSLLAACATGPAPQGHPPPPDTVKSIALRLRADNLDRLTPKEMTAVTAKIMENLKSWGYPLQSTEQPAKTATHILETWVSKAERKSLPPGFTFSMGSTDQRAPEQQKTDVVTVGCALLPTEGKAGKLSLSGEFGAENAGKSLFPGMTEKSKEHFYIDRMGSVCLNLLAELKIPKEKMRTAVQAPAWIPDMRIEIKTKEGKPKPGVSTPPSPSFKASEKTPQAVLKEPAKQEDEATVKTEERVDESDQRKQLIIHNQGTPIILEFGYDENRGMKP